MTVLGDEIFFLRHISVKTDVSAGDTAKVLALNKLFAG